ncbi:MAG: ligand-gated channel protein, partial [Bacteroidales bacterium]|nr:ligand-gated channel protein [Bacteroidales bacterium]
YLFANWDAGFFWNDLFAKGNKLTLLYDAYYQHSFPLYWENIGSADSKAYVPDQLSHNITLSYAFDHDRYTISAECRNITNAQLYDNFSLQKAGRAFYIKLRINLQGY